MGAELDFVDETKLTRPFDLVEKMEYLFVKVVEARNLPIRHNFYVEVKVGNMIATTRFLGNSSYKWNQVFAFEKDKIHVTDVDVLVKDQMRAEPNPQAYFGRVRFCIIDIPMRIQPTAPVASEWHKLVDETGTQVGLGDIKLSVWIGTQADECFPDAWFSDATRMSGDSVAYTRHKIYTSPKLWYLRVHVIQAQDLLLRPDILSSEIFVQVDSGSVRVRTSLSKNMGASAIWNEDLLLVAQEPFLDTLVMSVEQGTLAEHVSLGWHRLQLTSVVKRTGVGKVDMEWYNLDRPGVIETAREVKFASKINAKISLDGGYHVMDEPIHYSSDFRPSSEILQEPEIGVLELAIIKATDLVPMKMQTRTDAYCVAKYGPKWVRTRTVVDSLSPKWNEQYVWNVYEPCTVITIGVFDNNQLDANDRARGASDILMGKIRIRLSTLALNKVYTNSYPIIGLHPSGVKKMGEIHLAVRFSSLASYGMAARFYTYIRPLFPKHHYYFQLSSAQIDNLRKQAVNVIAYKLSTKDLPLRKEVVHLMLDLRPDMWSMRKATINYKRVTSLIGDFAALWKWLPDVRNWKNPLDTLFVTILCYLVLFCPMVIFPSVILGIFCVALKRYPKRPKQPCHIDAQLSSAGIATREDLEEELDTFPTQIEGETLRRRYDRLRVIAGDVQKMANDFATVGEIYFFTIRGVLAVSILWFLVGSRIQNMLGFRIGLENLITRLPSNRAFIL
ncbi:FT-interacting protein 3-like [Gastrolobium bilobum]|uniref:FT-interacting protein 3-like n=1 Tax=Gastrolobium bilobum TaxID=150636 RepID=UPI002AAFA41D|nr:FT-interacting protein 3-like [Gastrolobium bilobum]